MSLSRSPSPQPGGGWSSPGLHPDKSRSGSPTKSYCQLNGTPRGVTWASAQARSAKVSGYPAFSTRNQGFLQKHLRSLSWTLPQFNPGPVGKDYSDKEKLGRGRWPKLENLLAVLWRTIWRWRKRLSILAIIIMSIVLFFVTRKAQNEQRRSL